MFDVELTIDIEGQVVQKNYKYVDMLRLEALLDQYDAFGMNVVNIALTPVKIEGKANG